MMCSPPSRAINVLLQQVSKALLGEYVVAQKRKIPLRGLGLEHINEPCPDIHENLTSSILRSFKFQTDIFCLRERDLLKPDADEVSQYQAKGESKERATLLEHLATDELSFIFRLKGHGYYVSVEGVQVADYPWTNISCQGFQILWGLVIDLDKLSKWSNEFLNIYNLGLF
ncbi:acyl-coenzyme A oxidase 3, peroxisomal-like [Ananas comosus]|uniref:Acyl-coenzyme A oxidase 3, peroxisomal-like n=1 Tax=Ananas comosus TaxID=4615 RepID=A0A6P5ENJ7_ANACO|nr:acyl-coenzyme A oxidase 3, peroxisomal-like [Ananas comosus]XP_020082865.1 acyl-coenzyme A oxidase 3, peroxisomal-like [Ananas comosus]XP_020082866.1 acyl-coenzyme A oxidase 3, peroxisomal-like [Ananas comosus]XP_020082867.1 acyl-coenzyme A oxidase 3, peroxisomal-like [Ananas comosus]